MRVAVKAVIIAVCLASLAFAGACGSKTAVTTSSTSAPAKKLTSKQQAVAYFKQLKPISRADDVMEKSFEKRMSKLDVTQGYSWAVGINNLLVSHGHIRARLKAVKPPPRFRMAQARLEKAMAVEDRLLSLVQHAIQQAVYTHTVTPGFERQVHRSYARLHKAVRQYHKALRVAAKRSDVKVPKQLL